MTTRFDNDPELAPDDPLTVLLRPPAGHLAPPPGRYRTIRRAAARRRLLRTAATAAVACAAVAVVALPSYLSAPSAPRTPTVPLAPPPPAPTTPAPATATPVPATTTPAPIPTERRRGATVPPHPGEDTATRTVLPTPSRTAAADTRTTAVPDVARRTSSSEQTRASRPPGTAAPR
ncbi:hypothetical protein [Streptomyces nodosus]|uniref:hypothetical protein n=1 Tax=Streptomyces nodosus TaxID=40318 RepID=UPI0036E52436